MEIKNKHLVTNIYKNRRNFQKKIDVNNNRKHIFYIPNIKSTQNIFKNQLLNENMNKELESDSIILKDGTNINNTNIYDNKNINSNFNNNFYLKKSLNNNFNANITKNKDANTNNDYYKKIHYLSQNRSKKEKKTEKPFSSKKTLTEKNFFEESEASETNKNKNNYLSNINHKFKNNKASLTDNDDDENSNELSDIADQIVNLFPTRKKIKKIRSLHKINILENNNKIIPPKRHLINLNQIKNKNQRISPNNYTFKTVFVNNFCVMPMNSSMIDNNNKYINLNNKKKNSLFNLNNSNELNLTDRNLFTNSNYSVNIKQEKNINNSKKLIHYKKNQDKYNSPNNNNINYINEELNSFIINKKKRIILKNINIGNDMMTKINNNKKSNDNNNKKDLEQKNFKENNFNENYYYTTMDLSKLTFIKGKNTVNNKNSNNQNFINSDNNKNLIKNDKKDNNGVNNNNENKNNNVINKDNNKKHIKFDLSKNVLIFYNDKDYITKYKKISLNKSAKIRNLRTKIKPIIKKFNKEDIKINNNYVSKENFDEKEILSENILVFDDI